MTVDRAIRLGLRGIRGEVFLHRLAVPLDAADLTTPEDHGQLDMFGNECLGLWCVTAFGLRIASESKREAGSLVTG